MSRRTTMLPSQRGRVFLLGQNTFQMPGETFQTQPHDQVPQFFLRPQAENPDALLAGIHPMPDFLNDTMSYRDISWEQHSNWARQLLERLTSGPRENQVETLWLTDDDIHHLLAITSYGMESMTWLQRPFEIRGSRSRDGTGPYTQQHDPTLDRMVAAGYSSILDADQSTIDNARQHIEGRRWIVAPINTSNSHWSMSIFDRAAGHLYIFDTVELGRQERIRAIAERWAVYWNQLGMPNDFQYFVAETTQQAQGWECGHLCIYWVIRILREQTGQHLLPNTPTTENDVEILPAQQDYPIQTSSLPVSDWLPTNTPEAADGARLVFSTLTDLLRNELDRPLEHSVADSIENLIQDRYRDLDEEVDMMVLTDSPPASHNTAQNSAVLEQAQSLDAVLSTNRPLELSASRIDYLHGHSSDIAGKWMFNVNAMYGPQNEPPIPGRDLILGIQARSLHTIYNQNGEAMHSTVNFQVTSQFEGSRFNQATSWFEYRIPPVPSTSPEPKTKGKGKHPGNTGIPPNTPGPFRGPTRTPRRGPHSGSSDRPGSNETAIGPSPPTCPCRCPRCGNLHNRPLRSSEIPSSTSTRGTNTTLKMEPRSSDPDRATRCPAPTPASVLSRVSTGFGSATTQRLSSFGPSPGSLTNSSSLAESTPTRRGNPAPTSNPRATHATSTTSTSLPHVSRLVLSDSSNTSRRQPSVPEPLGRDPPRGQKGSTSTAKTRGPSGAQSSKSVSEGQPRRKRSPIRKSSIPVRVTRSRGIQLPDSVLHEYPPTRRKPTQKTESTTEQPSTPGPEPMEEDPRAEEGSESAAKTPKKSKRAPAKPRPKK